MKKLITSLFFSLAIMASYEANAQYCGSSHVSLGVGGCNIATTNGFGDINGYKCFTRGQNDTLIIPFKVYPAFTAAGNTVTIYKLKINSLDSLPCGLCWSTTLSSNPNNQVNEFDQSESGCIQITGNTLDLAGSYKLSLNLAVRTSPATNHPADDTTYNIPSIYSDAGGIILWVKVINSGDVCPDTIYTSRPSMHPSAVCHNVGIAEVSTVLTSLSIQPNPMSNQAKVSFVSENGGNQELRITNVVGSEVYHTTIAAKQGLNETTIIKDKLPVGIYILTVGSSQGMATKKFVIAD